MNLSAFISPLIQTVRDASSRILEVYENETLFNQQQTKADASPLTLADQAAHEIISQNLKELTPSIPVLSEEGKSISYEHRSEWEYFWMVDPLDGTKEFIKRNGEFTVNIALIHGEVPVLGMVHIPVTQHTYYAIKGKGAWKLEDDGTKTRLRVSHFHKDSCGLRIVCSRSHMSKAVSDFLKNFDKPTTISMGSSLKFMLLAEGKADIYPRLAPTMEWDTAAAHIIVEEAGGQVINVENQNTLEYNKEILLNPHFVALGGGSL